MGSKRPVIKNLLFKPNILHVDFFSPHVDEIIRPIVSKREHVWGSGISTLLWVSTYTLMCAEGIPRKFVDDPHHFSLMEHHRTDVSQTCSNFDIVPKRKY